jgi:hypothetical protein
VSGRVRRVRGVLGDSCSISGSDAAAVSVLRPSRDAELVAFWVEHHDMTKVIAVELLADSPSPGSDQFGCFGMDEVFALGYIPWRLACHPDVDVHPVLGCLGLRHP